MAVLKPMNPTVNYEGAWKELREIFDTHTLVIMSAGGEKRIPGASREHIKDVMDELEKKHKNLITLKERSNPEIVDYCIKKSVEARMENIHLKKELKEQKRKMVFRNIGYSKFIEKSKRKLFNIHLTTITDNSIEFNLDMKVTAKKFEYYKNAYNRGGDISWHGLKMRIAELNYSYPEGDIKEGMTFRYLRREEDVQRRS